MNIAMNRSPLEVIQVCKGGSLVLEAGRKRVVPWGGQPRARTSAKRQPQTAKVAERGRIRQD